MQTCRDRKLRLFDPRAGSEAVRVADGHSGIKGSRVVFLGDRDRIATTGVCQTHIARSAANWIAVQQNVRSSSWTVGDGWSYKLGNDIFGLKRVGFPSFRMCHSQTD